MSAATLNGNGGAATAASPDAREMAIASLLDAGRIIAIDVGFEHLRMGQVAERAGVSRASLYRYFESKETFIAVLLAHDLRVFVENLEPRNTNIDGKLVELFTTLTMFLQSNRVFERALTMESASLIGATVFTLGVRTEAVDLFNRHYPERDVITIAGAAVDIAFMCWLTGRQLGSAEALANYARRSLRMPSQVAEVIA